MKRKILVFALIALLGGAWLALEPGCPVRNLTGIPCPGCGMSRAWIRAAELDLAGAVGYHPLFWLLPVVAWLGWKEFRPFAKQAANIALSAAIAAALVLCWAVRLYFDLIP